MGIQRVKQYLKKNRGVSFSLRVLMVYGGLHLLVTNSVLFDVEITKGFGEALVIILVLVYRLLSFIVVPAVLVTGVFFKKISA